MQLMERDAFLPCRALFELYFELGAWYCNAPLYSLSRHLSIVLDSMLQFRLDTSYFALSIWLNLLNPSFMSLLL